MWFNFLTLLTALTISGVAAYYSIIGLTAIFAAAFWPIVIMGSVLEAGKIVTSVWLKKYWDRSGWQLKTYLTFAVAVLMLITSMGIFGFLSKAHMDQGVPSGDIAAKISLIDEKIKTERDNIEASRKALSQMDAQVDQRLSRGDSEQGAERAVQIRRQQANERAKLQKDIGEAQKKIAAFNEERAPIASQLRRVEAEVGPIKYVAALIYDDNPDQNLLEKAVRWVIIILVLVFDPLAIALILAANSSMRWQRNNTEETEPELKPKSDPAPHEPENITDINHELSQAVLPFDSAAEALASTATDPTLENLQKERDLLFNAHVVELARADDLQNKLLNTEAQLQELQSTLRKKEQDLEDIAKKLEEYLEGDNKTRDQALLEKESQNFLLQEQVRKQQQDIEALRFHIEELEGLRDLYKLVEQIRGEPQGVAVEPMATASDAGFGTAFPDNPRKSDMFVRVDMLPHRVYKFNGNKWIEVDKTATDTYAFNDEYIRHLVDMLARGQIELDHLSETEQAQIKNLLRQEAGRAQ